MDKKGREEELVYAFMRKAAHHANSSRHFDAIRTVFSTPKMLGYIFMEAPDKGAIAGFVEGMVGVYFRTCELVPIEARIALISPVMGGKQEGKRSTQTTLSSPAKFQQYWARIAGGLHNGDVGLVVEESASTSTACVKVIPRIPTARTDRERLLPLPPRRRRGKRPPQRLLSLEELVDHFGKKTITYAEGNYVFNGWQFSYDNFRLLRLPKRRLVEFHPQIEQVSEFADRVILSDSPEHPIPSFVIPNLIAVGDRVQVIEGELTGVVAVVHSKGDGVITIRPLDESTKAKDNLVDLRSAAVQVVFREGDCVQVRIGRLAGRSGIVCAVNFKQGLPTLCLLARKGRIS